MMTDQRLDLQSEKELKEELELLKRKVERERIARKSAEALLDAKSRELHNSNLELIKVNKNLEKSILKRTNTLSSLIQSLHAGILLEDENRRVMLVNETFCEFFGVPVDPEDLIGTDCSEAAAQSRHLFKEPEAFERGIDQLLRDRVKVVGEVLQMEDGRVLERDFLPIYIKDEYVGHLWKYRDITANFVADQKIKASEEKYRGIIEDMELGLLEVDQNHTIVKAYDRFCDMTGYSREELEGQNANTLLLPSNYEEVMAHQDEQRQEGRQGIYEVELRRKNGEMIWVLISGAPFFNEKGEYTGSIGIHYDITPRKNLEAELRKAREVAENARKAEKEFLANMSHEIRNPINAIVGLISLLYDTSLNSDQLDYLNNIKYSADILLGLISDVLDISKIESGKMELHEQDIELAESIKAVVQTFRFRNNKSIEFEVDVVSGIDYSVVGDPTIFNQVLMNLIGNAYKFTESGKITTELSLKEDLGDSIAVRISVKDTGIGIDQEQLETIFESFKQGNKQTKLRYGGTGLGLSIVKRLVDMYNGDIQVSSEPGQGSEFALTMIFRKSFGRKVASSNPRGSALIPDKINHVLVVEDNKINQQYLTGLLQKWEISYDMANHGGEALEWIKKKRYDLVLMDIRMPVMDGYETTIRIRSSEHNPNRDIPIIALTASALVDEKEKAISAGMNHHLSKPFSPEQLLHIFNLLKDHDLDMEENHSFQFSEELDADFLNSFYMEDFERAKLMFEIFLGNISDELTQLEEYFREQDWSGLAEIAHRIKPNFVMVGLSKQTDQMLEIETAAKALDKQLLEKIVPAFLTEFEVKNQLVVNELTKISKHLK
ncbi:MAG: PAS domain S-box protein [Marinoscillum sp.]